MNTKTLTRSTKVPSLSDRRSSWYIIDAKSKVLGRLATKAANILTGKNRTDYTPFLDLGDHVIIINAKHIHLTGTKEEDKKYYHHSGYPGGLKETNVAKLRSTYPDRIVRGAIRGMLPKNRLQARHLKKLHIFEGDNHSYEDKKPFEVKID
jgi:large subunit ribosomal protein L13